MEARIVAEEAQVIGPWSSRAQVNLAYRFCFPKGPNFCDVCDGEEIKTSLCAGCKTRRYCTRACQVTDWKAGGHKLVCKRICAERAEHAVPRRGRRVCVVGLTSKGGKPFNGLLGRIKSEPTDALDASGSKRFGIAIDNVPGIKKLLAANLEVQAETEADRDDLDIEQRSPRWAAAAKGANAMAKKAGFASSAKWAAARFREGAGARAVELYIRRGAVHGVARKQAVRRWLYNCTLRRAVRAGSGHGVGSALERAFAVKHVVRNMLSYVRIPQTEAWLMTKSRAIESTQYCGLFVKQAGTFQGRPFYANTEVETMFLCSVKGRWCVTTSAEMESVKKGKRRHAMEIKCAAQCRDPSPTPGGGRQTWISLRARHVDPTIKCVRPEPEHVDTICAKGENDRQQLLALDAVHVSGHRGDFADLMGLYICLPEMPRVGGSKVYTCTHNSDVHLYCSVELNWYISSTARMRAGKATGYIYSHSTFNLLKNGDGWLTISNTSTVWRPDKHIRVREATEVSGWVVFSCTRARPRSHETRNTPSSSLTRTRALLISQAEREHAVARAAELASVAEATRAVVLIAKDMSESGGFNDLSGKEMFGGVYVRSEEMEQQRVRIGGGTVRERGCVYEKVEVRPVVDKTVSLAKLCMMDESKGCSSVQALEETLADPALMAMFPGKAEVMQHVVDMARGRKPPVAAGDGRTFLYRSEFGNGWMVSDTGDMMAPMGKGNNGEGFLTPATKFTAETGMGLAGTIWEGGNPGITCETFETAEEAHAFWERLAPYRVHSAQAQWDDLPLEITKGVAFPPS